MNMPDTKAVLIDIDDTIVPMEELDPSDVSFTLGLQALRWIVAEAKKNGFPKIGVCSGRERWYCRVILILLGIPDAFSVVESGAFLFNPATQATIPHPSITPVVRDIFQRVYQERIRQLCEKHPEIILYEGNEINIALELKKTAKLTIPRLGEMVRDLLDGSSPPLSIRESSIAVDISPAGVDKGTGAKFYSEYTGIPLEQILGIGDSKGDFPMLELVGFVGCPQNASELCKALVKEKGGYISPLDYAQGVSDIISHFTGVKIS